MNRMDANGINDEMKQKLEEKRLFLMIVAGFRTADVFIDGVETKKGYLKCLVRSICEGAFVSIYK